MRRKAPVLLTIAVIIIGILGGAALLFVPGTDAPKIRLTLLDADGTKSVSIGETAEYVVKVENEGETTGHFKMTTQGEAEGWKSTISHDYVHLEPGKWQNVHLYVTPLSEEADPWIDVNVVATRADNVTLIGTTTYLKGTVQIRQAGLDVWKTYAPGRDVEEGDDLRTGLNSYAQFNFGDYLSIFLYPESEIHCRFSNNREGIVIYWFVLNLGKAAFRVDLPNNESGFTLQLTNGARVIVTSLDERVFMAGSDGYVRVFKDQVGYQGFPTRGNEGTKAEQQIVSGHDSDGVTFDSAVISYPKDRGIGKLSNALDETMGFENTGSFVAGGDFNGFVFKMDDRDNFYLYNGDASFVNLKLNTIGSGLFDISFTLFNPDSKSFTFKNIDTVSKTINVRFQADRTYISASSDMNYDLEIRNSDGDVFSATDIDLKEEHGNSFRVVDFTKILDTDPAPVIFGLDTDGDEITDKSAGITSGMNGKDISDALEEDEDEENEFLWIGIIFLLIFLLIVFYFIFIQPGKGEEGRTKEDREAAFRLLKEDLKPAQIAAAGVAEEEEKEKGELWDEITTPPTAETPVEEMVPPEIPETTTWKPRAPEDRLIEQYLQKKPEEITFPEPEVMRKAVKKQIDEMEQWWGEWNDELDEILKK